MSDISKLTFTEVINHQTEELVNELLAEEEEDGGKDNENSN